MLVLQIDVTVGVHFHVSFDQLDDYRSKTIETKGNRLILRESLVFIVKQPIYAVYMSRVGKEQ